ncbi:Uncharacterised protein [Pseudomonas aeruginosa]|nr:Uncharacterised protein [Pseudomonas aeruginosa]
MQEIAKGDFIKADWNPYMLMSYFPPAPGVIPETTAEKMVYRCVFEGEEALLKILAEGCCRHQRTLASIAEFCACVSGIEQTLEDELPLPSLLSHGMFASGNGLFVVTRFEEGKSWPDFIAGLDTLEKKLEAASALCNLLINVSWQRFRTWRSAPRQHSGVPKPGG